MDRTGPESSRFGLGNMWAQLPGIPAPLKHVVMCQFICACVKLDEKWTQIKESDKE